MSDVIEKSRRFYEKYVKDMIHNKYPEVEDRIAVGLVGEGSDCFGYDDELSRDHDFGTGVCLWLTDEDMNLFGRRLLFDYNELVESDERSYLTNRLRERRGVMTIHDFYSDILHIDCNTASCHMRESDWFNLDHACLKTATNGEVFRDDLGKFTAFRNYLLGYYPDRVWKVRIAEKLHEYAAALQVNYARCMTRGDLVTALLCKTRGISAAMELFFLLKREYPPYYKWTYRALCELDSKGVFATKIKELTEEAINLENWDGTRYHPTRLNYRDPIVSISEELASEIEFSLIEMGLTKRRSRYLETHIDELLDNE